MGIFNLFGKNKNQDKTRNEEKTYLHDQISKTNYYSDSAIDEYEQAVKLLSSSDADNQLEGRRIMKDLVFGYKADPRALLWAAREYEKHGSKSTAANYYKRAYENGIETAREGYERCYNPYHIIHSTDLFNYARGSRGSGTPYIEANNAIRKRQKDDYQNALHILNQKSSKEEVQNAAHTILLIANADGCCEPDAQKWVGDYYENVIKDYGKATVWYKKAADNGSIEGARCYADMLMTGKGVQQDIDAAMDYYRIAADEGHSAAQFVLGQYYAKQGNTEESQKYFTLYAISEYNQTNNTIKPSKSEIRKQSDGQGMASVVETLAQINELDKNAEWQKIDELYQPDDFCEKAYNYCRKQYGIDDLQKLYFEFCMTAFYGCICSAALYQKDKTPFEDEPAWDVIYKQINVEFTDANAERLLGTKNGEDKAERIFSIISSFFNHARSIMEKSQSNKNICISVMKEAYRLGMMVAQKELTI